MAITRSAMPPFVVANDRNLGNLGEITNTVGFVYLPITNVSKRSLSLSHRGNQRTNVGYRLRFSIVASGQPWTCGPPAGCGMVDIRIHPWAVDPQLQMQACCMSCGSCRPTLPHPSIHQPVSSVQLRWSLDKTRQAASRVRKRLVS